jgi:hypothetical protein
MLRRLSYVTLLVLCAAFALSLVQCAMVRTVSAAPTQWAKTYDSVSGNPKSTFNLNEAVNLTAYSSDIQDYYIVVVKPDLTSTFIGPITHGTTYSALHSTDLSDQVGVWYLIVGNFHAGFAVGYFQVVPFAPLGVVGVLAACFIGTGLKLRKKDKSTL